MDNLDNLDSSLLVESNMDLQNKNLELSKALISNNFFNEEEQNLIHYQLETDKILDRIENFLRGNQIKTDGKNSWYEEPKDPRLKNFNEYGVSELMRIISMYVTKETFLSIYDEERINEILGDLGDALADFIYCNINRIGMDTKFKQSKFIVIVLNIVHAIESCYRRALKGMEQQNIRSRSIVTQSNGVGGAGNARQMLNKRKWDPFRPGTW